MVSRLRDHIGRVGHGVVDAVDDIAVVLPTLLCDALGTRCSRLFKDMKMSPSVLQLSAPPENGQEVNFSAGLFPTRANTT